MFFKADRKGFSLLEMAIVMMMGGVLMASLSAMYRVYLERQAIENTLSNLKTVQTAIQTFYNANRRYPCPADPTLDIEAASAGDEVCTGPGIVTSSTGRDTKGDPDADPDAVLIGAVPFKALALGTYTDEKGVVHNYNSIANISSSSNLLDGWGRKITYAVAQSQTKSATYGHEYGAIYVATEYGDTLVAPEGAAHFVLVSHGKDGVGSYSKQGGAQSACNAGLSFDAENCNGDAVFMQGLISEVPGAEHYDDFISFQKVSIGSLWARAKDPMTGKTKVDIYNLNTGNVGVGVFDKTTPPSERLEVKAETPLKANIRADRIDSKYLCDHTGKYCFEAQILGGMVVGMQCITGAGHRGLISAIQNNTVVCEDPAAPAAVLPAFDCPAGQAITSIGFDGNHTCAEPPAGP